MVPVIFRKSIFYTTDSPTLRQILRAFLKKNRSHTQWRPARRRRAGRGLHPLQLQLIIHTCQSWCRQTSATRFCPAVSRMRLMAMKSVWNHQVRYWQAIYRPHSVNARISCYKSKCMCLARHHWLFHQCCWGACEAGACRRFSAQQIIEIWGAGPCRYATGKYEMSSGLSLTCSMAYLVGFRAARICRPAPTNTSQLFGACPPTMQTAGLNFHLHPLLTYAYFDCTE